MQTTDYNIPVFNNEDVADLNEYSKQMANALKAQLNRFGNPLTFKGNVATFADLPTEAVGGWIYNVTDENKNYVYSGTEWVIYSENFDTGNLATLDNVKELEEGIAGVDTGKLDKMVVSKQLNTAGWYRVAKYGNPGSTGVSFILNINSMYSYKNNISASLMLNLSYDKSKITQISSAISYLIVTKVRIVKEDNTHYIEIYYNDNNFNSVFVDIIHSNQFDYLEMLNFEAPTDTATVLDEISVGEFTTGVEYATNEFLDGKRIYKKRIDCGALSSISTHTSHGITNAENIWIDVSNSYAIATDGNVIPLPYANNNVDYNIVVYIDILGGDIEFYSKTQRTTQMYVTLKYTKN